METPLNEETPSLQTAKQLAYIELIKSNVNTNQRAHTWSQHCKGLLFIRQSATEDVSVCHVTHHQSSHQSPNLPFQPIKDKNKTSFY